MANPYAPTSAESSRLGPMRAPNAKPVVPKTFKPKAPAKPKVAANDSFLLPLPYAPGQINQTAQSGYNADAALAKQNAALGYLTPDQQTARAAQQGSQVQSLYSNLANQIAGIQHVGVDQTNAGTATLGAQNAATSATGNPVASATGTVNPGVTGNQGAQAVLASQGAGQGNFLGALQGSALASGTAGQAHALAAGQSNIQQDQASQQKTLASLLSGIATPSARESAMITANTGAQAGNLQTELAQYQSGVAQQQFEESLGQKTQADAQGLANRTLLAKINQSNANSRADAGNQTRANIANAGNRTREQIAADNRSAAAKREREANATSTANNKRTNAAKGKTGGVGSYKNYKVTYDVPQPNKTGKDPITGLPTSTKVKDKRVVKTVPANVWNQFAASGPIGKRNLSILGAPKGSTVRHHTGY